VRSDYYPYNPQTQSNLEPGERCPWWPGATLDWVSQFNLSQFWCDVYTYISELFTQTEARVMVARPTWSSRADNEDIDRISARLPCVVDRVGPRLAAAIGDLTRFAIEARARDDFGLRSVRLLCVDGACQLYLMLDLEYVAPDA